MTSRELPNPTAGDRREDELTVREEIVQYISASARPIDRSLFEFLEGQQDASRILEALAAYQNDNGGFGHALEPDLRTPHSSALATSVAFQYLVAVDAPATNELVGTGVRYLVESLDSSAYRWQTIHPSTNDYPSAPWWDYQRSLRSTEWGNPSAEILGYLLRFAELVNDESLLASLRERALVRLSQIDQPDFHELLCYKRLFEQADTATKARLFPKLSALMVKSVEPDPRKWTSYQATPLTFVDWPESPFASLFDWALLEADFERLLGSTVDGDHWEPSWSWNNTFPDEWKMAKREWSGKLTVQNLRVLQSFGVL